MQKPIFIQATNLSDAWFQALYNVLKFGRTFKIDSGSYAGETRIELDFITVQVLAPYLRDYEGLPFIPEIPPTIDLPAPVTRDYLREYVPYLLTAERAENEAYTYGERLNAASVPSSSYTNNYIMEEIESGRAKHVGKAIHSISIDDAYDINVIRLNQIQYIIDTYKKHGHRNNQMVLQVAQPADILLSDPPCLRHIDTRIQDGKLHFYPYFRSWSMWGGFPANLAAISMLQEHMANEIGVEQGEIIATSKGLHLYGFEEKLAKIRCMVE